MSARAADTGRAPADAGARSSAREQSGDMELGSQIALVLRTDPP
jgi:hypothetical protein